MNNSEFIRALLNEKEGGQLALFSEIDVRGITETVCAFLNAKGGRILAGANRKGEISTPHAFDEKLVELSQYVYTKIIPESLIGIRAEEYDGGRMVLIEVIEGSRKPYTLNGKSYIRQDSKTMVADDNDMSRLLRNRRIEEFSWEKSPVLEATLEDFAIEDIVAAIESSNLFNRASKFSPKEPLKFLSSLQLFRNNQFTNAAVVLFAKEPTYFLPQCRMRIIEFERGKTSDKFRNITLIESNLFRAFAEAQSYFRMHTPIVSEFSNRDWKRKDRLQYPQKALDEGVINAMMHRDYSDPTGEVFIGIYPDKIEIINSGELPPSLKDKDLKTNHRSMPSNPAITHVVFLCGMIEKIGRGTTMINEQFEDLGLQSPHWTSKNETTMLTLHGTSKTVDLNSRTVHFLVDYPFQGSFTRDDYYNFFRGEISERTARLDISKLVSGKWIEKWDEGAVTRYTRLDGPLPDVRHIRKYER